MIHPTREEWLSYLYDELQAGARQPLQAHLEGCAHCREEVASWQSASLRLSEWKLPRARRSSRARPVLRWAIAAAVIAFAAVGGVRLHSLEKELKQLRTDVHVQVQRELGVALRQLAANESKSANTDVPSLIAAVAQNLEEKRLEDQQATLTALQKLNAQRVADYAALRKELETVAVFSEAGLLSAQNRISSLASIPTAVSENK